MSYSYFNTTESSGPVLDKYESKAKSQEVRILAYFSDAGVIKRSPSEICASVFNGQVPLTSVRRALSNLTKRGMLQKLDTQRDGPYGRPEHCWSLPAGQQRLF